MRQGGNAIIDVANQGMNILSRFTGDAPEVPPLGVDWSAGVSESWLRAPFTYTSRVDGGTRTLPAWVLVTHLFNHQAHHRGQLTTLLSLLSQMGLEPGVTDLPFMPEVVSCAATLP